MKNSEDKKMNPYLKFALMMGVSFIMMYAIMFSNVAETSHIMLSHTRTYMTLLMVAPMAISMLLFMWSMYHNKKANYIILSVAALVTILSFAGLRRQTGIRDVQYMQAMIPHHSSAIMTSEAVEFEDPEVQQLANEIIAAQKREIDLMNRMIKRIESNE